MPRVTHVAHAQQRYATIPVLDPATGQPKRTPVMKTITDSRGDGTPFERQVQKTTKRGIPVFMAVTVADKSQPLPNRVCERCSNEIAVGQPYKHISPKAGQTRYRCGICPDWHVWEYSQSLAARTAQIAHEAHEAINDADDTDPVTDAITAAAEAIRALAEEKAEAAENLREGFGHDTSQSEELDSQAEQLQSWADDVEAADILDFPEPEEGDCDTCAGEGTVDDEDSDDLDATVDCKDCDGTGRVTPDQPTDEQIEEWRSLVEDATNALDDCPV